MFSSNDNKIRKCVYKLKEFINTNQIIFNKKMI